MNNFIPYAKQYDSSTDIEKRKRGFKSRDLSQGALSWGFRKSSQRITASAKLAVSFNSGTSALYAATYAAKVGPLMNASRPQTVLLPRPAVRF